MIPPGRRSAAVWIGAFAALAGSLAFLYPDSHQRDGGFHFLFARWSWIHPELLVGVWSRPAFTVLYSFPAQVGYPAAKLFTVLLCAACAWQTWRLAVELNLARPSLAIPLLVFQPSFLLMSSETMTEPLFALLLIIALRLQYSGRSIAGMLVASSLILARPEGFPVIAIWAAWLFIFKQVRVLNLLWLVAGGVAWWIAALIISGDPLFIPREWPRDWATISAPYGSGMPWGYAARLPEAVGPLLVVLFVVGVIHSFARRRFRALALIALTILLVHSVLWWIGGFGSAGYSRYMATVAPAMALLALVGWSVIADRAQAWRRSIRTGGAAVVLGISGLFAILYVDGWHPSRDAWAIDDMQTALIENKKPFSLLVWSHPYMAIRNDVDPWAQPTWGNREENLRIIANLPRETLVFWDSNIGPNSMHLSAADFERAGFERFHSRSYVLTRYVKKHGWMGVDGPRHQEMHLLYRP
jgi:hypothetical protein